MKNKKKVMTVLVCMLCLMAFLPIQTLAAAKASIKLSASTATIKVGKTKTLTATVTGASKTVTWKSSNTKIATVDSYGKIKAKKAGKVTITARANGKSAKCTVTVKKPSYKELYKEFLAKSSVKAGDSFTIIPKYFYILNMNGSGVPELIVTNKSTSQQVCTYYVYTVINSKVTYIGNCSRKGMAGVPEVTYNTKYKGILSSGWYNGVGITYRSWYKLNNSGKKLIRKQHIEEYFYPDEKYYIGTTDSKSKKVSLAKAKSFNKKYFNSRNMKTYKMKANTAANRTKYVK